jgi:tyrosinase
MMQRWTSQALAVPPRSSWQRADLEFEGVEHDGASFVMHVFLNNPDADEATPRTPEQRYAGYLTVFAHGDCWGDVGHCDTAEPVSAFDRRPPHPLLPFDATLEITDALSALPLGTGPDGTGEVTVTVLAFNKNGDTDGVLRFKQLTLLTYA